MREVVCDVIWFSNKSSLTLNNLDNEFVSIWKKGKKHEDDIHLFEIIVEETMNGIENPVFVNENNNKNTKLSSEHIDSNKKMSFSMLFSLTFHSLGIIFGDM